ncbi:MAG: FkbM family methyltransferase [Desulfobacteraceae bacterium]|nr:MAG: FkbM family methyltransferase [Desulfobacteraceae bacterium]
MREQIRKVIISLFKFAGIGIIRYDTLQSLKTQASAYKKMKKDIDFLASLDENKVGKTLRHIHLLLKSKAQMRQDLFVLAELDFKRDGFFVEFGATNGIRLSNTYLLEKEFGWRGILAEPARVYHKDLKKNRNTNVDFACIWNKTGQTLNFNETDDPVLSTISDFSSKDRYSETRKYGNTYSVNTISLMDLLRKYDAPYRIDYLSIDTEGSEYEILKAFDFDAYRISIITCEHNFTDDRQKIYDLLTSQGYKRRYQDLSSVDDWYVLQ